MFQNTFLNKLSHTISHTSFIALVILFVQQPSRPTSASARLFHKKDVLLPIRQPPKNFYYNPSRYTIASHCYRIEFLHSGLFFGVHMFFFFTRREYNNSGTYRSIHFVSHQYARAARTALFLRLKHKFRADKHEHAATDLELFEHVITHAPNMRAPSYITRDLKQFIYDAI